MIDTQLWNALLLLGCKIIPCRMMELRVRPTFARTTLILKCFSTGKHIASISVAADDGFAPFCGRHTRCSQLYHGERSSFREACPSVMWDTLVRHGHKDGITSISGRSGRVLRISGVKPHFASG